MKRSLLIAFGILAITAPVSAQSLTGAGATFPNPIYTKWFDAYNKKTSVYFDVQSATPKRGSTTTDTRTYFFHVIANYP